MSKFCTSCGSTLPDDATFCTVCGSVQPAANDFSQPSDSFSQGDYAPANAVITPQNHFSDGSFYNSAQPFNNPEVSPAYNGAVIEAGKNKKRNMIIGLCAIAAVAVVAVVVIVIIVSNMHKDYEDPILNFFDSIVQTDTDLCMDALNEDFVDYMDDYYTNHRSEDLEIQMEEDLEDLLDELQDEYGDNIKFTYKVTKVKELKKSDLSEVEDDFDYDYDIDVDVDEGYKLTLEVTVKGSDEKKTKRITAEVYNIDDKWCFSPDSFGDFFDKLVDSFC